MYELRPFFCSQAIPNGYEWLYIDLSVNKWRINLTSNQFAQGMRSRMGLLSSYFDAIGLMISRTNISAYKSSFYIRFFANTRVYPGDFRTHVFVFLPRSTTEQKPFLSKKVLNCQRTKIDVHSFYIWMSIDPNIFSLCNLFC